MKTILLLLPSIFLIACTSPGVKKSKVVPSVAIDETYRERIELIEGSDTEEQLERRQKKVTLVLQPALYYSIGYLELLREIKKSEIQVSAIVASGFAGVVALIMAKSKNYNEATWLTFKLLKRLEGIPPYTESWLKKIKVFIDKELLRKPTRFEVLVPSKDQNLVFLSGTGSVHKRVLKSLDIKSSSSWLASPSDLSHFFVGAENDSEFDLYYFSAFPKRLVMHYGDGLLWGVYSKLALFKIIREDLVRIDSSRDIEIDNAEKISKIQNLFKFAEEFSFKESE